MYILLPGYLQKIMLGMSKQAWDNVFAMSNTPKKYISLQSIKYAELSAKVLEAAEMAMHSRSLLHGDESETVPLDHLMVTLQRIALAAAQVSRNDESVNAAKAFVGTMGSDNVPEFDNVAYVERWADSVLRDGDGGPLMRVVKE